MEGKRPAPSGPPQINMEIGEKEAEGIYSNFVVISHSLSEFVLDFARVLPGTPKSKVFARVVGGMDVLNAMAAVPVDGEAPRTAITMTKVRVEKRN